jgi:hypothetical protein
MNPYLEQSAAWPDFHKAFIPALRAQLTPLVGPKYFVKIEEHIYVQDADDAGEQSLYIADLAVAKEDSGPSHTGAASDGGVLAVAHPPVRVRLPAVRGKKRVPYLTVVNLEDREVVTVVELLSPSNKRPGPDREVFVAKRKELLSAAVNYVELDLLRGFPRMPVRNLPACDYYALVSRPPARPEADLWPVKLREKLPTVLIPLRPGDREPAIDLQAALNRVYDEAGYARYIYRASPEPPLSAADAEWARQLLAATPPRTGG